MDQYLESLTVSIYISRKCIIFWYLTRHAIVKVALTQIKPANQGLLGTIRAHEYKPKFLLFSWLCLLGQCRFYWFLLKSRLQISKTRRNFADICWCFVTMLAQRYVAQVSDSADNVHKSDGHLVYCVTAQNFNGLPPFFFLNKVMGMIEELGTHKY